MEKKIFEKSRRKEINLHGEVELNKTEKKVMNVVIVITFFAFIINFFLFGEGITPFYSFFIIMGVPAVLLILLAIKYFVIKKTPMKLESYDIKVDKNVFTGKDEVEISNYKEKMINEKEENKE